MLNTIGGRQKQLLKLLRGSKPGMSVDELSKGLEITRNAVRQHLTALIGHGQVERVGAVATGGRPQTRYAITAAGRELFPRNYATVAGALITQLVDTLGKEPVGKMLADLGRAVAATQPPLPVEPGDDGPTRALAERLDGLGYEAGPARAD